MRFSSLFFPSWLGLSGKRKASGTRTSLCGASCHLPRVVSVHVGSRNPVTSLKQKHLLRVTSGPGAVDTGVKNALPALKSSVAQTREACEGKNVKTLWQVL